MTDIPCGPGLIRFPESEACVEYEDCSGDEWPNLVPPPGLYVRANGGPGGDGSRLAPFGSLLEALEAAEPGTTIVLGAGDHFVNSSSTIDSVTLRGKCPSETRLSGGGLSLRNAVLRDLTTSDSIVVEAAQTATVTRAHLTTTRLRAGPNARAHLSVVSGDRLDVRVDSGATARLTQTMLFGATTASSVSLGA